MKPIHFVCCVLIALVPNVFAEQKVNITIYYESLCPHSSSFIVDQLEPNHETFKEYINVELVPYGKAKATPSNDGIKFNCQHGKSECAGNKAHSCGIYLSPNESIAVKFAACAMKSRKYDECAKNSGLDQNEYTKCYNSELGTLLQLKAALKTKTMATHGTGMIAFVPTVVFNDIFSQDKADKSQRDLAKILCDEIQSATGVRPNSCSQF